MPKETDILESSANTVEEVLESLESSQNSNVDQCSLQDVENMIEHLLKTLPKINRSALRQEMMNMVVTMQKTPTTFDINEGLAQAQGYRDRLAEIFIYAQNEYKLRKRCLEMLFDAINLISKASSADKRRGEATMKYPLMLIQVEAAEIFVKEVESILSNMKGTLDAISRQASVLSMQISLGEIRKKSGNPNESEAEETVRETSWSNF